MAQKLSGSILIVDDNPAHRTLIKRNIRKANVQNTIAEAASLSEARKLLFDDSSGKDITLVILDLNLGRERGTDLLVEIRSSAEFRNLATIVLSTSTLDKDIQESYTAGADCYLVKTDDSAQFAREIAGALAFFSSKMG